MTVSSRPTDLTATIVGERPQDGARVQALIEQAFGPGRFAKTAERLREHNHPDLTLSLVAWSDDQAVGCVRMWPIFIGGRPAILLGPFAVEDAWRSRGLGGRLVERACQAARDHGHAVVLLVGDEPYFRRFGFEPAPAGSIKLPGPVDYRRVLWLNLQGDAISPAGAVTAPAR
jgi:predicted N-acetyltransferase YhbS